MGYYCIEYDFFTISTETMFYRHRQRFRNKESKTYNQKIQKYTIIPNKAVISKKVKLYGCTLFRQQ